MRATRRGRVLIVLAAGALAASGAAFFLNDDRVSGPSQEDMAAALGADVMTHLWRGHVPGRSGEILLVPKPHHFMISEWDLRTLATDQPFEKTTHAGPWAYLTRVPIVAYQPGTIPPGTSDEPADIAMFAPTYARLLGMDGFESATCTLEEIVPCSGPTGIETPPRVIVTVVIDGGGWNVLDRYPDAWPNIRRLMERGLVYEEATIGSAPATTGALHATFGTGFYPNEHGLPGNILRTPDGEIEDVFLDNADPRFIEKPTVSELWDEANDNDAIVATISFEGWHLGMIGHGAQRPGGDKDLAAIWDRPERAWTINEDYYDLPAFLRRTDRDRLARYEDQLDERDGERDGMWFSETPLTLRRNKNERAASPAFARFTGDAVVELIESSRLGADEIADLLWVEMKMPDSAGHAWNLVRPEVEDVLAATDAQIGRFVSSLDRVIGRGEYLFLLSADHGQQPLPDEVGGWRISTSEVVRDLVVRFGDIVDAPSPADLYLDMNALEERGHTLDEVAAWLGSYTVDENIPDGAPGRDLVPRDRLDDTIFAGALTTEFFASLDPVDIRAFGAGDYRQGDLPVSAD